MGTTSSSEKVEELDEKASSQARNKVNPTSSKKSGPRKTRMRQLEEDMQDGASNHLSRSAFKQFKQSLNELQEEDQEIADIDYEKYEYPFENLVFEGGGAKGQGYVGCCEVSHCSSYSVISGVK